MSVTPFECDTDLPSICFVLLTSYGYFNSDLATASGGGSRQYYYLSTELADETDVHFIIGDYGQPKREVREGVTLHRTYEPSRDDALVSRCLKFGQLFLALRRADADVYVYRGYPLKATAMALLTTILGARWVYNFNSDGHFDRAAALPSPINRLFCWALGDADAVIAQTDNQADRLRNEYGVNPAVIPSGYPEPDRVHPHDDRDHFLWVGRIDETQKRPHRYLDVAAAIPNAEFLLIGPPSSNETYQQRIERRADKLENVTYLGPVDPDDIHKYYERAVALVNTSAFEGFPSTFIEAWRYDTPVLSLDVDVNRFVDEVQAVPFPDGEFAAFERIAARLATDPAYRQSMSEPTWRQFTTYLQLDTVVDQYREILSDL